MSRRNQIARSIKSKIDDSDFLDLDASDRLSKKGIYYITGEIDEDSLLDIHKDILDKHLDPTWKSDIQLIVNSVGGSCFEAWSLVDLLDWVKMDVRTTGMGACMSMGAILLACGTPGKRVVSKNCTIMVHQHASGTWDKHGELVALTKSSHDEYERHIRFWTEHSKYTTSAQVVHSLMTTYDHYMTATEAYHHGIVDHISGVSEAELRKQEPIQKVKKKSTRKAKPSSNS